MQGLKLRVVLAAALAAFCAGPACALEIISLERSGDCAVAVFSGSVTVSGIGFKDDSFGGALTLPLAFSRDAKEYSNIRIAAKPLHDRLLRAFETGAVFKGAASEPVLTVIGTRNPSPTSRVAGVDVAFDGELVVSYAFLKVSRRNPKTGGRTVYYRMLSPENLSVPESFRKKIRATALPSAEKAFALAGK